MIYVVSDIHGCYDEFITLLDKAGFDKKKDELIIAGDIVDRGKKSLEMLRILEKCPDNYTFLMGNHDYDFLSYCKTITEKFDARSDKSKDFDTFCDEGILTYIKDYYGTVADLIINRNVGIEDFKKWQNCISYLPYYVKRTVGDKEYIIVHAGYISEKEYADIPFDIKVMKGIQGGIKWYYLWAREEGIRYGGKDGSTIIFGHTPTIISTEIFYNPSGKVSVIEKPSRKGKRSRRFINIDCGCAYREYDGKGNLAMIRLDDEKVFYCYG